MTACHHVMARPRVAGSGTVVNMEGDPPAWGLGEVLTSADRKKTNYVTNHSQITLNVNT